MGRFLDSFKLDRFEEIEEYLLESCVLNVDDDDNDVDESKMKPLTLLIRANSFKCIGLCWPPSLNTQSILIYILSFKNTYQLPTRQKIKRCSIIFIQTVG